MTYFIHHMLRPSATLVSAVVAPIALAWAFPFKPASIKKKEPLAFSNDVALSILLSLEIGFTLPVLAYSRNANDFSHALVEFLVPLGAVSIGVCSLLAIASVVLNRSPRLRTALLVTYAVGFLGLWIQTFFRPIPIGSLTGSPVVWDDYWAAARDSMYWSWMAIAAFYFRHVWIPRLRSVFFPLLLFQVGTIVWCAHRMNPDTEAYKFKVATADRLFSFSKHRNVILLLLDAFQGTVFNQEVNGGRHPAGLGPGPDPAAYASGASTRLALDGFTYYQNATSTFMSTLYSVPNLLTASLYDNSVPYRQYISKIAKTNNLFSSLDQAGVQVSASFDREWIFSGQMLSLGDRLRRPIDIRGAANDVPLLYDLTLFKAMPYVLKPVVYGNAQWFLSRWWGYWTMRKRGDAILVPLCSKASDIRFLNDFHTQARADEERPTFKFIHLRTPHPPFDLDDHFKIHVSSGAEFADYQTSCRAALRILRTFLDDLKAKHLYDQSLIIVVSDHGLGFPAFPTDHSVHDAQVWTPQMVSSFNFIKGRLLPTVLVKNFGSRGPLKVSQAPVTLGDVPQTVADALHVPRDFSGDHHVYRSFFKSKEGEPRTRWSRYYMVPVAPALYVTTEAEFRVDGHSWNDESWHFTHRAFVKNRGEVRIAEDRGPRSDFQSTLESVNTDYYENTNT